MAPFTPANPLHLLSPSSETQIAKKLINLEVSIRGEANTLLKRLLSNVYSVLPCELGETQMKVMFTALIFGQTRIVTFTVFSFGHLYLVILISLE